MVWSATASDQAANAARASLSVRSAQGHQAVSADAQAGGPNGGCRCCVSGQVTQVPVGTVTTD
jgi:hypothetical protein